MKKKQTKELMLGKSSIKKEDSLPGGHSKLLKQASTLLLKVKVHLVLKNAQ